MVLNDEWVSTVVHVFNMRTIILRVVMPGHNAIAAALIIQVDCLNACRDNQLAIAQYFYPVVQ